MGLNNSGYLQEVQPLAIPDLKNGTKQINSSSYEPLLQIRALAKYDFISSLKAFALISMLELD